MDVSPGVHSFWLSHLQRRKHLTWSLLEDGMDQREREILKTEATGCVRNERRVLAFLLEALISKLSSYSGLFFPTAPLMHLHWETCCTLWSLKKQSMNKKSNSECVFFALTRYRWMPRRRVITHASARLDSREPTANPYPRSVRTTCARMEGRASKVSQDIFASVLLETLTKRTTARSLPAAIRVPVEMVRIPSCSRFTSFCRKRQLKRQMLNTRQSFQVLPKRKSKEETEAASESMMQASLVLKRRQTSWEQLFFNALLLCSS